jgi:hypothetical protein
MKLGACTIVTVVYPRDQFNYSKDQQSYSHGSTGDVAVQRKESPREETQCVCMVTHSKYSQTSHSPARTYARARLSDSTEISSSDEMYTVACWMHETRGIKRNFEAEAGVRSGLKEWR